MFHQLSIRQKIICGYVVSFGIAVLGTTVGLVIGDRYFQHARQQMIMADQEGYLLNKLQGLLLEVDSHQQELLFFLDQTQTLQQKNSQIEAHLKETETLLNELRKFSQTNLQADLQALLNKYDTTLVEYIQQLRILLQQISSLISCPDEYL
ncbi:hypothetical protein SD80_026375 [Scytonema tolypothrichoides VB-61278]|nr:hypothetical protein SD80_026375 [Scytonema tolypothrichoides VB-61278]